MDKRIIMKKFKLTGVLLITLCLNSLTVFAEDPTGFDDDVVDVPMPIDNWIPYMILLVIAYGYVILNKKINPIK